jgi:hypothetical protein
MAQFSVMTETLFLDLSQKEKWRELLGRLPVDQQDIYYTPEYYELYERKEDNKACCFVVVQDDEIALYPFLLNSINVLNLLDLEEDYYDIQGAYGYNGVVSSSYQKRFIQSFYDHFSKFCLDQRIIAEFTRFHPLLNNVGFSQEFLQVWFNRKTIYLNLDQSPEGIWNQSYSSKNRNMIRKARKHGLCVTTSDDLQDYEDFYAIYTETMKNVGAEKYYFFDKAYFLDFRRLLKDQQQLFLVKLNEQTVCSLLLMSMKSYAHYHLSARDVRYSAYAANNLALDVAIQMAREKGCQKIHLGGGRTAQENDSLFNFKANFSHDRANFYIGGNIYHPEIYRKICEAWEKKYPEKKNALSSWILRYRY